MFILMSKWGKYSSAANEKIMFEKASNEMGPQQSWTRRNDGITTETL